MRLSGRLSGRLTAVVCAGAVLLEPTAGVAAKSCVTATEWRTRADAEKERVYVNRTDGVFLFEYTPDSDGGSKLEGNPFYIPLQAKPNKTYRFETLIRTGNGTGFTVRVNGAVDAKTSKPLDFKLGQNVSRAINTAIRTKTANIELYVRGEHDVKFWSFVGPTRLCEL